MAMMLLMMMLSFLERNINENIKVSKDVDWKYESLNLLKA